MSEPEVTPKAVLSSASLNGAQIEMATGLSLDDIEALKTDSSEEVRALIAAKFGAQYDHLHQGKIHQLTNDVLHLFSKDRSKTVRLRFVESVKSSHRLPKALANRLARDDLEIAAQILTDSPALSDADLEGIIQDMPEGYALPIADRRPLSATVSASLIEHKGTLKVVCRLIDNEEAAFSDTSLTWIFEWSLTNPVVSERLQRRPHLPFEIMRQQVSALGEKLKWDAISRQTMKKTEAAQLQGQIHGSARHRLRRGGTRLNQIFRDLQYRYDEGKLTPIEIIGFLRDQKINLVEFSLAVVTKLDLRRIRNLLYGVDKRGLIALCLCAGFTTSEYLAFRIALGLIEMSASVDRMEVTYEAITAEFAKEQFDAMRDQPGQVSAWLNGYGDRADFQSMLPSRG